VNVSELKNKFFVVLGAKRSGLAAAKLLKSKGFRVMLSEKSASVDEKIIHELETLGIEYETGGHSLKAMQADIGVISPGVPTHAPVVQEMLGANRMMISEVELASWFCSAKVIAITGTDGKTTVTSLCRHILEQHAKDNGYKVLALGNIGEAFSSRVLELDENDVVVLEVSSFQLDFCWRFRPDIAIITNITADHLDRYDNDISKYEASKYKITENQNESDWLIYNNDNQRLHHHFYGNPESTSAQQFAFGLEIEGLIGVKHGGYTDGGKLVIKINNETVPIMNAAEITTPNFRGKHNIYNAIAAAAAARIMQIQSEVIGEGIRTFKGVEHRLEFVREINGVEYINDSKATTVNALSSALDALDTKAVLIMGGRDKGNDYSVIAERVHKKVKAIIAIGEAREKIKHALSSATRVIEVSGLEEAVAAAKTLSKPGESVLLSPSCASFDMFSSYEERGRVFKDLVAAI
jgi:UDP-N-acetylmuramoylalanine--D-glutamate ligase